MSDGKILDDQAKRARSRRNYALAGLLLFFVALFFVMTIVRLGGHVTDMP